ncbi:hypothetical protein ARMSODRAFT_957297 [Armillaria solidipes]|uniref:Uncharacterized protein n=1 Tax=Armillaria solidipes TaxID=1076256 RepID=A0A2H3BDN8_9AGAR|nr:hypothetical protein ARMSODRAFT_957297 [Armillaria solidipes]
MAKLTGNSATSSYRFPQTHDGQMNPKVQRYDVDNQAEDAASASDAGIRGPMELQHSDLETDDDTSIVQNSPGLADLTGIARSFQPQTELLNPCAKINEFILNTVCFHPGDSQLVLTPHLQHPHVNVAITHSDEWSSALSQGDDSDVLPRVLSDYMVIVRNGVAMLEAR